ncbi:MAG: exodeoxyribonuclease VII small subunit [Chitinophagaceae bacterium]|jgi:exodeoxyribonuclease VII small subunit|nr:exodeoxyribonuclease VII small subunit [Chitinophagaceae bacterium]
MKKKTFDEAWQELEKLVAAIEDENIPLDELAEKVKAAKNLIRYCEEKLRSIENDLKSDESSE